MASSHPASHSADALHATTPLLYSCIAYNNTILTEHTATSSPTVAHLASVVLPKIKHDKSGKLSFSHQANLIHYISLSPEDYPQLTAANLTFLVIGRSSVGQRVPFGYLVEVKKRFLAQYDPERTDFEALPPYGCAAFNGRLREMLVQYGATAEGREDAIAKAQREIEDVREIMTENIERVLERGERIDLLVDKTDRLGGNARDFRVRSKGLRRRMWWKNVRLMVLLAVVVVFLIYLFVGFGCGLPAWQRCTRRS